MQYSMQQNMAAFTHKPGISKLFVVIIDILPQKEGLDLPRYIHKISQLLCNYSTATNVIYRFKVSGESKILSVISVSNVIGLERTIAGLWFLGSVKVECFPVIAYEHFAIGDHMPKPSSAGLCKEGLYWMEFDIDHPDKSADELLSIWKSEAETVLSTRHKEGLSIELYKVVAQRKVHVFINADSPEYVDLLSVKLPLMQKSGAHFRISCRALQFLDDFSSRITSATEQM